MFTLLAIQNHFPKASFTSSNLSRFTFLKNNYANVFIFRNGLNMCTSSNISLSFLELSFGYFFQIFDNRYYLFNRKKVFLELSRTAQKLKIFIKDFCSKCDQIRMKILLCYKLESYQRFTQD